MQRPEKSTSATTAAGKCHQLNRSHATVDRHTISGTFVAPSAEIGFVKDMETGYSRPSRTFQRTLRRDMIAQ